MNGSPVRRPPAGLARRVLGENSLVERALGAGFDRLNEALRTLSIREVITLDARRQITSLSIQQLGRPPAPASTA
ncbi:hypothetical protein ABZY19_38980 [Streptomyces sp. NPDC006475]|uniref:hypothetical protein n=1 Tax=Streptomyces sp. NPDC006475 TaxID=3155719 RepID=UPI0033B7CFFB